MDKLRQASLPVVDEATAKAFDGYLSAGEKARAAAKHDKKKKEHQAVLLAKFDELGVDRFALPDGRIVQRESEGREMPAKPKTYQSWWKIFQASA